MFLAAGLCKAPMLFWSLFGAVSGGTNQSASATTIDSSVAQIIKNHPYILTFASLCAGTSVYFTRRLPPRYRIAGVVTIGTAALIWYSKDGIQRIEQRINEIAQAIKRLEKQGIEFLAMVQKLQEQLTIANDGISHIEKDGAKQKDLLTVENKINEVDQRLKKLTPTIEETAQGVKALLAQPNKHAGLFW